MIRRHIADLLTSTVLWAAPDDPAGAPKAPTTVAPLDLGEFDHAMGDNGASGQDTDGFEEVDQDGSGAEILERHQSVQHIDSEDDETSTSVRFEGGDVEEGGQRRDKAPAAAEPDPAAAAAVEGEDETKLPEWVQKRLQREKRATARVAAELDAMKRTPAVQPKPVEAAPAAPAEAPKAADFEDFEEYMEAKALYDKSQKAAKDKPAPKAEPNSPPSTASEAMRVQVAGVIGEINAVLKDDHPELFKIVNDNTNPKGLKITPGMILAIGETDNPAAVLQAFADNPALSVEIAGLPPEKAAARIIKLDKPSAAAAPTQQQPLKKLSDAPAPVKPLDGSSRVAPSYEEADFNTFEAARRAEEKADDPFGW